MNDKEKILKMVSEGKISVEDAERLLTAINESREQSSKPEGKLLQVIDRVKKAMPSSGKIIIDIQSSKGENVKVKLPLRLASLAFSMIPKDKVKEMDREGVNLKEILTGISDMIDEVDEDILNITSASGDCIRIYIDRS